MLLSRLIYASTHQIETGTKDILHIVTEAREKNSKCGITGLLLYDTRFFMQWIEGHRDMVTEVLQHIFKDDRHSHPAILAYDEVTKREFSEWTMAYVSMHSIEEKLICKYFPSQEFNPYFLSAAGACEFLLEMAKYKSDPQAPD